MIVEGKKNKHDSLKKMDMNISYDTRKLSLIPEFKKIIIIKMISKKRENNFSIQSF